MVDKFNEAKKYYDDVIYAPNKYIAFEPAGNLKKEDVYQSILYALKESGEARTISHSNKNTQRTPIEIYKNQLIGKLGEFATYECLKRMYPNQHVDRPDTTILGKGKWDVGDLFVVNHGSREKWQIKTTMHSYSQFLLLVTHDYDLDGKYIFNSNNSDTKIDYDKFIFQRIKYENNDDQNFLYQKIYKAKDKIINNSNPIDLIKRGFEYYLKEEPNFQYEDFHYITKKELIENIINNSHIMYKGQHFIGSAKRRPILGKTHSTKLIDTNYYVEVFDMHKAKELYSGD
ncbi:hypothetical protein OQI87_09155 [Lactobacillus kefiranofaciens]|uniref:hypothetical protein n=1 Tax=Lactobacillus kefiranofaciens TaxID=267818 RepID=UPI002469C34F|nr:hypothetical protein [Lactobacillus kefiranofaciens]MDH5101232.1 hypothetical protein [Lactobacillus kefiranofaciens]